ncbi:MAG: major capsid protein [Wigfec virus K19_180]|nr:MAG: major capsid protein [Wigfec virus K19_180]
MSGHKRGNIFKNVLSANPKSNVFDLSHDLKLSFNMGDLIPVSLMEVVPGDKFNITTEQMLRLAPMISPVMHKVDVTVHFFFCPNRILWPGWETFITGGQNPDTSATPPYFDITTVKGDLADYLGLPLGASAQVSAIPHAVYQKIYNDYYRDQNLIPEVECSLVDGLNPAGNFNILRRRAWEHDYFTSALPWAQKGSAVSIPIGSFDDVPVVLSGNNSPGGVRNAVTGNPAGTDGAIFGDYDAVSGTNITKTGSATGGTVFYDPANTLEAQTSSLDLEPATINDLRKAFRLQEWLEKNARGGTRYIEQILAHFGVKSSDARLQRPEYLGGNKNPIVISEVLQTAEGQETPQGNMAGHGIGIGQSKSFTYRAEEHGYIMGIMSVMPKTAYQQGIPKHFLRTNREEYYWPTFAHLGEQPILNKELYNVLGDPVNDDVFGYTPRYSEYKYVSSRVAGDFRDNLAFWHMGRIFGSRPNLNGNFVSSDPTHRIFAVEDPADQKIYAHVFNRVHAVRPMPLFGTPTF